MHTRSVRSEGASSCAVAETWVRRFAALPCVRGRRGMTSWELPVGSGRIKPDVMAFSKDVQGSKIQTGCRSLSGA